MTNEEKRKIDTLRNEGCGCTAIAAALGLSLNSVKSYCRRTKPQAVNPVTIEIRSRKAAVNTAVQNLFK